MEPTGSERNRMFLNLRFCHTHIINHYMKRPTNLMSTSVHTTLSTSLPANGLSQRPLVYSGRTRSRDPVEDIFAFKIASARFAKRLVALSINDELGST